MNDKVTVLYMLTNGIQQTEEFNDFKSSHFAAIVKPVPQRDLDGELLLRPGAAGRRRAGGPDGFFRVFDTYVTYTATSRLSFGLDVNYVTNEVNKADESLLAAGHRRLRALSGHRSGCARRFATNGSTTRACSAASIRCSRR